MVKESEKIFMFKKKKIFAYENSEGDKGIICAKSYEEAEKIFYKKYTKRKIMDPLNPDEDYWDNGAYLFEMGVVKNNELYDCFLI